MEIFDTRYFIINKRLMSIVGLWPFDTGIRKIVMKLFLVTIMSLSLMPQMYGLYKSVGVKIDDLLEHTTQIIFIGGIEMKLVTTIMAGKGLKQVYETVADNWKIVDDETERNILKEYSERGRLISFAYIGYTIMPSLFILFYPMTPIVLNILVPLNESRLAENTPMMNGKYPMNRHEHFVVLYVFDTFVYLSVIFVIISIDTMFAATMEHCLALFAIVRFTDIIESSYSLTFLFLMILTVMGISCGALLYYLRFGQTFEHVRCIGLFMGLIIHLFYLSWPGQKLSDYSSDLYDDTYMNEWYNISIRAQKLLKIIRLRCIKPCQLTAGGICVMNFSTFAAFMKSSMSYITIFLSLT